MVYLTREDFITRHPIAEMESGRVFPTVVFTFRFVVFSSFTRCLIWISRFSIYNSHFSTFPPPPARASPSTDGHPLMCST